MAKRTIVLSDESGRADGLIRVDGDVVIVNANVRTDTCMLYDGKEVRAYRVDGNKFIAERDRNWNNVECLFYYCGTPVLYGKSAGKGDIHRMIAFIDEEKRRRRERKRQEEQRKRAQKLKEDEQRKKEESILNQNSQEKVDVVSIGRPLHPDFYYSVKPALDEMFVCYPEEELLAKIIPDSNWVRVTCAGNSCYVVGLMRIEGEVKYICYGVPASGDLTPPAELKDVCEWIPTGSSTDGYWMVFQDAVSGETLKKIA